MGGCLEHKKGLKQNRLKFCIRRQKIWLVPINSRKLDRKDREMSTKTFLFQSVNQIIYEKKTEKQEPENIKESEVEFMIDHEIWNQKLWWSENWRSSSLFNRKKVNERPKNAKISRQSTEWSGFFLLTDKMMMPKDFQPDVFEKRNFCHPGMTKGWLMSTFSGDQKQTKISKKNRTFSEANTWGDTLKFH